MNWKKKKSWRNRHELELDFKRFWEEFRSSSSEKEKETALNLAVDAFCKLAKQLADVAQLVTMLVETHIFSFVVGRAFVTDIEISKINNKARSLVVEGVLRFFAEVTKDGICPGANLLSAIELLISGAVGFLLVCRCSRRFINNQSPYTYVKSLLMPLV